jgi:hypothetical protein
MRQTIELGGANKDYNTRKARARAVNCYIETSRDGDYRDIRRTPGLVKFTDVGLGPIRAMYRLKNLVYVVSRNELYSVDSTGTATLLGDVGGSTAMAKINANGTDDNQVIVISEGEGYLYDTTTGFRKITDEDFFADLHVASLNQIFWTNKPDSNVFLGSEVANGDSWPTDRFASAEQSPDPISAVVAAKTNLWVMGQETAEYWQTNAANTTIPVRPVAGATIERGVGSQRSIKGSAAEKISDLNIEKAIMGENFSSNPGYTAPELAEGFFIDHPIHKLYVLTFPQDGATWVFDATTRMWHQRKSAGLDRWRARESVIAFNKVLVGDYREGVLWEHKDGVFNEDGNTLSFEVVTPPISSDRSGLFITMAELTMEVGVGSISNIDALGVPKAEPITPKIQVYFSKDGGVTFARKTDVSIGQVGERGIRVISREFGLVPRTFNFVLKYVVTDDVPVILHNVVVDIEEGM